MDPTTDASSAPTSSARPSPCGGCAQRLAAAERTGYVAGLADSAQRRTGCPDCRRDTVRLVLLVVAVGLLVGYSVDVLLAGDRRMVRS